MPPARAAFFSVTPLLPAGPSLQDALGFYRDHLGFSVVWRSDSMAGVARDAISFNLIESTNEEWARNASLSIGVSNLDALYEEYAGLPARLGPLEMKAWGRREFHMIIPSGVCLQFYTQEE
ncbi:MAG: hypothetical protein JO270_24500 [Acidobacteriaceae bacterium]|nr:hypothetical protein [Acidobacteriaceae bacterium]MBV8569304.1 hypothetical protein [Acidobacteriaceae bacterium]